MSAHTTILLSLAFYLFILFRQALEFGNFGLRKWPGGSNFLCFFVSFGGVGRARAKGKIGVPGHEF
ncbi:hypothetical protein QL093DRAFT_2241638 [Fusarium oxysporum]|jgi:hypothetical protein|nr:hypothetical protein QL093DRAFT_2241638 [Fusarium oxysporum]